jgi:hypothetical protein
MQKPQRAHMHPHEEDSNRRLRKFFLLSSSISFIVILSLSGTGIFLAFKNYIHNEAESSAVRISEALLEQGRLDLIHRDAQGNARLGLEPENFQKFDRRLRETLRALDVPKIKIFTAEKTILYSTERAIIGRLDSENKKLEQALEGKIYSQFETEGEFWDLEDEQRFDVDIVETYIPISDENGRMIGAYEIYLDVSRYQHDVIHFVIFSLAIITAVLAVIFLIIYAQLRKATGIIHCKTEQIKVLSGLLPICSFCKKIRDEDGNWEMLEEYISFHSESEFSHSFCPECVAKHYPELGLSEKNYT